MSKKNKERSALSKWWYNSTYDMTLFSWVVLIAMILLTIKLAMWLF